MMSQVNTVVAMKEDILRDREVPGEEVTTVPARDHLIIGQDVINKGNYYFKEVYK